MLTRWAFLSIIGGMTALAVLPDHSSAWPRLRHRCCRACCHETASKAAADKVIKHSGEMLKGKIGTITKSSVTLDGNKHSVESIKALEFEGEPSDLTQGRNLITSDRANYKKAYSLFARVKTTNRNMKADLDFFKALCRAKMGRARAMKTFLTDYSNSYHYYEANEVMAELAIAVAAKATDSDRVLKIAEDYAGRLATATGLPTIKQKGVLLRGNILLTQKSYAAAIQQFKMVEADKTADQGFTVTHNIMCAKVGRAKCLAATGKPDAGVTLANEVIARAQGGDNDLHARAYNALGFCHRVAKRYEDAVLAYMHTEVLYFQDSVLRTEARKNLSELFTELGYKERAKDPPWKRRRPPY